MSDQRPGDQRDLVVLAEGRDREVLHRFRRQGDGGVARPRRPARTPVRRGRRPVRPTPSATAAASSPASAPSAPQTAAAAPGRRPGREPDLHGGGHTQPSRASAIRIHRRAFTPVGVVPAPPGLSGLRRADLSAARRSRARRRHPAAVDARVRPGRRDHDGRARRAAARQRRAALVRLRRRGRPASSSEADGITAAEAAPVRAARPDPLPRARADPRAGRLVPAPPPAVGPLDRAGRAASCSPC